MSIENIFMIRLNGWLGGRYIFGDVERYITLYICFSIKVLLSKSSLTKVRMRKMSTEFQSATQMIFFQMLTLYQ